MKNILSNIVRIAASIVVWFACVFGSLVAAIWMLFAIFVNSKRSWRIALAYDRLSNAWTGGNDAETISSRAYRAMTEGRRWGCVLCKLLDKIQKDHCKNSAGI